MKKFPKAGLLIVTLVIPALIFTFLNFFAKNHYDLPYFIPQKDVNGNVLVQNGDTLFAKINAVCPELGEVNFRKKLTVISTLPKNCSDSCELVYAQLTRIIALRGEIKQLEILTIAAQNFSPVAKLPEKMGKRGWVVAVREEGVLDNCLYEGISFKSRLAGSNPASGLVLVDEEGYVRGYYRGGDEQETDRLMAEIKILDYETKTKTL